MELNQRIGRAIAYSGKKNSQIAKECARTPAAVSQWISGTSKNLRQDSLHALAVACGVRMEWLASGELPMAAEDVNDNNVRENHNNYKKRRPLPLISWVQAGAWSEAIDNFQPGDAEAWLDSVFESSNSSFCLTVVGASMSPEYLEGDIIQVDPELEARHNDDVVVRTASGDVSFKRLQVDGGSMFLIALNKDWPERIIKIPDGSEVCGVVVASWRKRRC